MKFNTYCWKYRYLTTISYKILNLIDFFSFCILGVGANFFGEILQPQGGSTNGQMAGNGTTPAGKQVVSGDLDASLANLTSNLNLGAGFGK